VIRTPVSSATCVRVKRTLILFVQGRVIGNDATQYDDASATEGGLELVANSNITVGDWSTDRPDDRLVEDSSIHLGQQNECRQSGGTSLIFSKPNTVTTTDRAIHAILHPVDGGITGVYFNFLDTNNWWRVVFAPDSSCVSLQQNDAGSFSTLKTVSPDGLDTTKHDVYILFTTTEVNVTMDFVQIMNKKSISTTVTNGYNVGLYSSHSTNNIYGDLVVAQLQYLPNITPPTPGWLFCGVFYD
jgi:hypothetical protein